MDRNLLRSAYQAAALLGDEDSFRGCPILLETGELVEASAAVLDDAPWLSERARCAGLLFLDPKLGEPVAITFAVRLLSSAVYERPEKEHSSRNSKFLAECAQLQAKAKLALDLRRRIPTAQGLRRRGSRNGPSTLF